MKIKDIYIHSFRGIPNELSLSLTDTKGKAVSCIIYGDNGAGKSSVIDAIEFCLQGRIERSQVIRNPKRPSPLSYASRILCGSTVKIQFDNDYNCERSIEVVHKDAKTEISMDNKRMDPNFSNVPLVLRRNDIISFNIIPSDKRQILFFSFLYSDRKNANEILESDCFTEDDPFIITLRERYTDVKHERARLLTSLSDLLKVDQNLIPFSIQNKLSDYFTGNFYLKDKKAFTKGGKLKKALNPSVYNVCKNLILNINKKTSIISQIKRELEDYVNPMREGLRDRKATNKKFLEEASKYLSLSFNEISNVDYVNSIKLSVGDWTTASLDIDVKLNNGKHVTPNNIFSEANYDLMILLLYVSIIRVGAEHGQIKIIVLDDVLQSVDSTIRANFLDYILREFKDWQIILSIHDRLWLNQAKSIFQRKGHSIKQIEMYDWTFKDGPKCRYDDVRMYDDSLDKVIQMNNNGMMAAMSGRIIELMCYHLSFSLSLGIERKYDDKYTIGDIWPALRSKLSKSSLSSIVDNVDRMLVIRNLLGCHYNVWADSLSDAEVKDFALSVKTLYDKTFCKDCCTWIKYINKYDIIAECNCHKIQYRKDKP